MIVNPKNREEVTQVDIIKSPMNKVCFGKAKKIEENKSKSRKLKAKPIKISKLKEKKLYL